MPQASAADVCGPTGSRKRLLTGELNKTNLRIPSNVTSNTLESIPEPSSPDGPRKRRRRSQKQVEGNLLMPGGHESSSISTSEPPQMAEEHIEEQLFRTSTFASYSSNIADNRQPVRTSSISVRETSNTDDAERGVPPIGEIVKSWLAFRPFGLWEAVGKVRNITSWFSVTHLEEEDTPVDVDMESNMPGMQQTILTKAELKTEPPSHPHLGLQSDGSSEYSTDEYSQNSPDFGPTTKSEKFTPDSSWSSIQEPGKSYLLSEGKQREFKMTIAPPPSAQASIDDSGGPDSAGPTKSAMNDFDGDLLGPNCFIQMPRQFFQVGRVFEVLWTEPKSDRRIPKKISTSPSPNCVQGAHSSVRCFIVVRQKRRVCTCLPLYFRAGTRTGGDDEVESPDYAVANTFEGQILSKIGHDMTEELFSVDVEDRQEPIGPMACIDFDHEHTRTIEYTKGVANIGKIDDEDIWRLSQNFERSSAFKATEEVAKGGNSDHDEDEDVHEVLEVDCSPSSSEGLLPFSHSGARGRSTSLDPGSPSTSEPGPITPEDEGTFNRHNVIVFPRGLRRQHERDRDPSSILLDTASHADLATSIYADKLNVPRYRLSKPQMVAGIGGQIVEISEYISVGLEWHHGKFRENHKFFILEGKHDFELLWSARTIQDRGIFTKPADKRKNRELRENAVRMAQENEAAFASQDSQEWGSAEYDYANESHGQQNNQDKSEIAPSKDGGKDVDG